MERARRDSQESKEGAVRLLGAVRRWPNNAIQGKMCSRNDKQEDGAKVIGVDAEYIMSLKASVLSIPWYLSFGVKSTPYRRQTPSET